LRAVPLLFAVAPVQTIGLPILVLLRWVPYPLRSRTLAAHGRPVPAWRRACFVAGLLVLEVAFSAPVDHLSDQLLVAHMVEHLLIGDIASLLITFFYRQTPKLVENGHLYLAVPPLYRLSHAGKVFYARDDKHRDELIRKEFHANAKVEIGRFKGLGEMLASQLKETTMDRRKRTLLRVVVLEEQRKETDRSVERLMGNKPEARFEFIQERAEFADEEMLDV